MSSLLPASAAHTPRETGGVHLFYWRARAVDALDGLQHRLYFKEEVGASLPAGTSRQGAREPTGTRPLSGKEGQRANASDSVAVDENPNRLATEQTKARKEEDCPENAASRVSLEAKEKGPQHAEPCQSSSRLLQTASEADHGLKNQKQPMCSSTWTAHVVIRKKRRELWMSDGEKIEVVLDTCPSRSFENVS